MELTYQLTGKQKAAILLISLGPETAVQAFKYMTEDEIDAITLEISNMRQVRNEQKEKIIDEFHQLAEAQKFISQGGIEYAKDVLEKALGQHKAIDIINRLKSSLKVKPFGFARKADASQILNILQHEHVQTIALVLSYLEPSQASQILSKLPAERKMEVAKRIALMDQTSPEVITQVEQVLEQKLSALSNQDFTTTGGINSIIQVLSGVDRSTEKTILEQLEADDPELAENIRKRMFVFEDIVKLDDRSLQRVLREVAEEDLIISLRIASDDVKSAIFRNMSSRRVEKMQDDLDTMGPVRLRDVEEAQSRVVQLIRQLEESGEIGVSSGRGEDVYV